MKHSCSAEYLFINTLGCRHSPFTFVYFYTFIVAKSRIEFKHFRDDSDGTVVPLSVAHLQNHRQVYARQPGGSS